MAQRNRKNQPRTWNSNSMKSGMKWAASKLLWVYCSHLLVQLLANKQALASGVLELELVDLRQVDTAPRAVGQNEAPFRLAVCLKEAFASQLDGPCAFGNATLTLDHLDPSNLGRMDKLASRSNPWHGGEEKSARNKTPEHWGSQMMNVVRIPFSFRWTVSLWTDARSVSSEMASCRSNSRSASRARILASHIIFGRLFDLARSSGRSAAACLVASVHLAVGAPAPA